MTPPASVSSSASPSRRFWTRTLVALARHLLQTMPWVTLLVGCASGTVVLAVMAHFAGHTSLNQDTVRFTFLPSVAALAFVPHVDFRPLIQTTPVPAWVAGAGKVVLAGPVLALTCWVQLRLMTSTIPAGSVGHLPAVYPLLAQFTGWCLLTLAIAACCERTRYSALSGIIAIAATFTMITIASYTDELRRQLVTPPARPNTATIIWYSVGAAAIGVTCLAMRDQWHRYTRRLHR